MFEELGSSTMIAIELVDVSAGIAFWAKLLLLDEHHCLGVLAFLTKDVFLNEPTDDEKISLQDSEFDICDSNIAYIFDYLNDF